MNPIRNLKKNNHSARMIGEINIPDATYKLYMGKKMPCDSSLPNCEGIVIEYTDVKNDKCVLMMGDVNYASFNAARFAEQEDGFADSQIDYLIAPHHGSEHTEYQLITDYRKNTKKTGTQAVICCTGEENSNRPNKEHREELEIRFDKVLTTENDASKSSYSIKICL